MKLLKFLEPNGTVIYKDGKGNITFPEGRPLLTRMSDRFMELAGKTIIVGETEVLGYIIFKQEFLSNTYLAYDNRLLGEIAKGIYEAKESIRWGFWESLWNAGLLHPEPGYMPCFKDIGL